MNNTWPNRAMRRCLRATAAALGSILITAAVLAGCANESAAPALVSTAPSETRPAATTWAATTQAPTTAVSATQASITETSVTELRPAESTGSWTVVSVPQDGGLAVSLAIGSEPPATSSWQLIKLGAGVGSAVGDLVEIDYEMVSWSSGEVVESTQADFGGPLAVLLGAEDIPRVLEAAILNQPVGTRLMVLFEIDLLDLPDYLDQNDAYVLAVDIVNLDG